MNLMSSRKVFVSFEIRHLRWINTTCMSMGNACTQICFQLAEFIATTQLLFTHDAGIMWAVSCHSRVTLHTANPSVGSVQAELAVKFQEDAFTYGIAHPLWGQDIQFTKRPQHHPPLKNYVNFNVFESLGAPFAMMSDGPRQFVCIRRRC